MPPTTKAPLTDREREIAQLTADGKSPAEIAVALNIAASTVKVHLGNALEKLGISGHGGTKKLIMHGKELLKG